MPIRAYLDGHKFYGETIRQMGLAFEMAVFSLRVATDENDPVRAVIAQRIIALAKAGEDDPERLCEGGLRAVKLQRNGSAFLRSSGLNADFPNPHRPRASPPVRPASSS